MPTITVFSGLTEFSHTFELVSCSNNLYQMKNYERKNLDWRQWLIQTHSALIQLWEK